MHTATHEGIGAGVWWNWGPYDTCSKLLVNDNTRTCRIEPFLRDDESGDYLVQLGSTLAILVCASPSVELDRSGCVVAEVSCAVVRRSQALILSLMMKRYRLGSAYASTEFALKALVSHRLTFLGGRLKILQRKMP